MVTEERTIEVVLISAMNLKKVKMFGREQRCYAVASIYPSQKLATAVDKIGGVDPIWNSTLKFTCAEAHIHPPASAYYSITVDIYSHSSYFAPKLLGSAVLPLRDIFTFASGDPKDTPNVQKQQPFMVTYDVRRSSGRVKGAVNLAIRLGAKKSQQSSAEDFNKLISEHGLSEEDVVTGYPAIGPGQSYPAPAPQFAPLGPLPRRPQITPVRPSALPSSSSRRPTYQRYSCNRGGRHKKHKTSVALLLIAGTVLAMMLF